MCQSDEEQVLGQRSYAIVFLGLNVSSSAHNFGYIVMVNGSNAVLQRLRTKFKLKLLLLFFYY